MLDKPCANSSVNVPLLSIFSKLLWGKKRPEKSPVFLTGRGVTGAAKLSLLYISCRYESLITLVSRLIMLSNKKKSNHINYHYVSDAVKISL